jgi:hypothetical protein
MGVVRKSIDRWTPPTLDASSAREEGSPTTNHFASGALKYPEGLRDARLTAAVGASMVRVTPDDDCGRDRDARKCEPGAEGATAPEPLRQKDRSRMALWKATL